MKMIAVSVALLLLLVAFGCTQNATTYVCSDGRQVANASLCVGHAHRSTGRWTSASGASSPCAGRCWAAGRGRNVCAVDGDQRGERRPPRALGRDVVIVDSHRSIATRTETRSRARAKESTNAGDTRIITANKTWRKHAKDRNHNACNRHASVIDASRNVEEHKQTIYDDK